MRIGVKVNGEERYVASIAKAGFLSAHLNMADRPKCGEIKHRLRVEGYDTSVETENVRHAWPEIALSVGDTVQLSVLDEGDGTPAAETRKSSESPKNLFASLELATRALAVGQDFEKHVFDLLREAEAQEEVEEAKRVRRAVGHLVAALYEHWYSLIWRRHASLVPDDVKGELL